MNYYTFIDDSLFSELQELSLWILAHESVLGCVFKLIQICTYLETLS